MLLWFVQDIGSMVLDDMPAQCKCKSLPPAFAAAFATAVATRWSCLRRAWIL
jgi:hypothetical protein